ncbi:MAG: energy transducer TonB, partial [Crocinitomicaceae bacterium]|nr:energy transducer TonB [Crocinitomicaceae bacterium]
INHIEKVKGKLQEHFSFFKNMYLDYYTLNLFLKQQIDTSAIIGFKAALEKKKEVAERIKQIKDNNKKTKYSKEKFVIFHEPIDVDYDVTSELVTTSNKTYVSAMKSIINNFQMYYDDPRIETKSEVKYETEYEVAAQFPGGEKELMKFIYCNLNLASLKIDESKIVIISFIIDNNGQVLDIKVNRGISETLDNEAIRIVSLMPNWTPGKKNGKPVKSRYNLPIYFDKEKKERNCQ